MADMRGKTVLVTGATNGVGEVTARVLAGMGARVFVHGRNEAKGAATVAAIKAGTRNDAVEFVKADFARLSSVRAMAEEVLSRAPRLDVLVNNAGGIYVDRTLTADGFETTFGINHLAHFLLTNLLLDRLKASAPARIVNVSSIVHWAGWIDFDDLQCERRYSAMRSYSQAKLANILFTRGAAKRLEGAGVTANALHPGSVRSGFGYNNSGGLSRFVISLSSPFMLSPEQGARTSIYLASAPEVAGVSGAYFARCKPARSSGRARDDAAAEKLWTVSARLTELA